MSISIPEVAEKIHSLLAGQGVQVHMYSPVGESVSDPRDSVRFIVHKPNLVIRINKDDESLSLMSAKQIYGETIHTQLRNLARDYLLSFDYRLFGKQLKAKGEKLDAKRAAEQEEAETIEEDIDMNESDQVGHIIDKALIYPTEYRGKIHKGGTLDDVRDVLRTNGVRVRGSQALEDLIKSNGFQVVRGRSWAGYGKDGYGIPRREGVVVVSPDLYTGENIPSGHISAALKAKLDAQGGEHVDEAYAVSLDRKTKTMTMIQQHWREIPREYKRVENGKRYAWPGGVSDRYYDVPEDEFWEVRLYGRSAAGQADLDSRKSGGSDIVGDLFGSKPAETDEALAEAKGFSRPTGTSRTSYQKLDDSISIVVRHKKRISEEDEERPGIRSRNLESVYIRRGGERFRMSENHLPSARAMARHMQNGGEFWDEIGESINRAATDMKKLSRFVQYVNRRGLINEDNSEYVELAREQLNSIKSVIESMGGQRGYARNSKRIADLMSAAPEALDEDLESLFVEKKKDDRVVTAMEELKGLVAKRRSFQRAIDEAVEGETFADLKNMLEESDMYDYNDARAKLSYQVSQLGSAAQDSTLSSYLTDISSKISSGGQLSQHEYGTIKRCLMNVPGQQVTESGAYGIRHDIVNFSSYAGKYHDGAHGLIPDGEGGHHLVQATGDVPRRYFLDGEEIDWEDLKRFAGKRPVKPRQGFEPEYDRPNVKKLAELNPPSQQATEGIGSTVKRGLKKAGRIAKGWADSDTPGGPKAVRDRVRASDDEFIDRSADRPEDDVVKGSPADLHRRLARQERKRRGR